VKVEQRIALSRKPAKAKAGEESLYTVAEYQEEIKALNEMKAVEDTKMTLDHKEIPGIRQRLQEKEAARPALAKRVESVSHLLPSSRGGTDRHNNVLFFLRYRIMWKSARIPSNRSSP
jgi:hypothetical protein